MRKHQIENISWQEVLWQRPYDLEAVQNILAQLANLTPRGAVIWEIRGRNGQVSHLLGADKQYIGKIEEVFRAHGDVKFHTLPRAARLPVGMAKQLRITHPQLSLKTDIAEAVIRAELAAMTEDRDGTELVLQVILGMAYPPAPIPASLPDPHATWLEVLIGDVHQATAESRKAVREKAEQYSFQAVIRIGASGVNGLSRLRSILSALKVLESAGVRIYTDSENPERLTRVHVPWHFPLKLSVKELSNFLLLPTGVCAGIDANARNKIVFGLNATDAKAMAAMAPELSAEDFMLLPRHHVYASFQAGGKNTGWIQGRTMPPLPALREASVVRARSAALYGTPWEQVDQEYLSMLDGSPPDGAAGDAPIGRRKRS